MKSKLLLILYLTALTTARIPTNPPQHIESITTVVPTSHKKDNIPPLLKSPSKSTDPPDQIHLDLCDCQPATGEPGGLSCDKEGFFIASFERQGSWVAGGGAVPLSRAICCRPCLPTDLPDDSPIFDDGDEPLALVSMGCHASTDPLGVRCEADGNSFISGFTSAVHVFSAVDTQYPVDTSQCCTPALLMESGDAWELERCDCGVSTDPEHSVSCSISSGGGDGGGDGGGSSEKNNNSSGGAEIPTGSILSGFDFFRISPLGQIVPIGPAKCCGVCLTGKIHPAADCRDLNHCSGTGVCLLGRCECLQGWGSPDCSQSLANRGGRVPPWAISLIVIGSCLIGIIVLSAAAHVAEIIFESRSRRATESDDDGDGDEARRPLLLRIDADDAGSVGSQDTEGGECDDDDVLVGGLEERIDQVIHQLEGGSDRGSEGEAAGTAGRGGNDEEGEEVISDGEESNIEEEGREEGEQEIRDVAGSSVPSSSSGRGRLSSASTTLQQQLQRGNNTTTVETTHPPQQQQQSTGDVVLSAASERQEERPVDVNANDQLEKPAGGAATTSLQSYMGIGPLSGVDCVVCMIRPVQTVVIPCGHVCMCRRCSRRLNRCPVCRKDVVRRQRLFV